uniref:Uncharacterized protein LOC113797709 n=1 Tax=Dermatophagoides pteronyssinus TaxID=6956 RepID=A0A6P6YGI8_DERPT|nr:uncharacterized protein LOC113797709 [Dermatophagoides pteronyssinus]
MGVCGGDAYLDECSGICIQPDLVAIDKHSSIVLMNRDCRGLCLNPSATVIATATDSNDKESSSNQQQQNNPSVTATQSYQLDRCGFCSLSSTQQQSTPSMNDPMTMLSPSMDCKGNCQLPGLVKHSIVCGQCINQQNEMSTVIDNCGHCLSEGHPCSCDRDPIRCGCIDQNNCYLIKNLMPMAIPSTVPVNISIVGYFYPYVNQLYCVIRSQSEFEIIESFPVQFLYKNKTFIQCTVKLEQSGQYVMGLGFRSNVLITPPKDLLQLYVFDSKAVNLTTIQPQRSFSNESDLPLMIKFNDDDNHELPPTPIRCLVQYESGEQELSDYGQDQYSCRLKESGLRTKSQTIRLYPTFDGINLIGQGFDHLIQASAPKIFPLSSFISEDSLSIIVNFDKSVNIELIENHIRENIVDIGDDDDLALIMCDYLLTESTIEQLSLFELESCRWATRTQFIISILKPFASDMIEIQFKPQVLSEYGQKYSLLNEASSANISKLSNHLNWWSYEPMIAIIGPNEISFCGIFSLIGHYSSPRGTTDVDFEWKVSGEVTSDLRQYVQSQRKSTNLLLNAEMFDINTEYLFTFTAFIHARRQSIEAQHSLIRLGYESPNLIIYSTNLLNNNPIHENDPVILFGDFTIPDCIFPPQLITMHWATNDPSVLFPIKQISKRYSSIFPIEPYSMPPDHLTSFTLNAYIGFYTNQSSKAMFSIKPKPVQLKANPANGINRITIGSKSGMLIIPSNTNDNIRQKRLVYQWSCHDTKTGQPCYYNFQSSFNHGGLHKNPLLITREIQTQSSLVLNSSSFQPNNQYLIGLQVFDANDSRSNSETEYILLNVLDGLKPQIFVGPVYINGEYLVPYNQHFSTFVIPSGSDIVIKGKVLLQNGLKSVQWKSQTFRYPLLWANDPINGGDQEIHTELYLYGDTLTAYGTYNFKLEACSYTNECSWAEISLLAAQSTTMCEVGIESHVEFEMTFASIEKCNLSPSSSPVTYQIYLEDEHYSLKLPLTMPQLSPVIIFPGIPVPIFNENQFTRLTVKTCDRFQTCTLHRSYPIRVEHSPNLTQSILQLIQHARRVYQTGDMLMAMNYLNPILLKHDFETIENVTNLFEMAINSSIEFATTALQLPNLTLSPGHYELMFSMFSHALHKTDKLELRRKLLNLIIRYFEKADAHHIKISIKNIRIIYANVMNSFVSFNHNHRRENDDEENRKFLKDIRQTYRSIKQAIATRIPLGAHTVILAERINYHEDATTTTTLPTSKIHTAYTEIVHSDNVEDLFLKVQMSPNQTIQAKVQFGPEIRQMFNKSWNCGRPRHLCSSIVQFVTVFPDDNPFPHPSDQQSHRLSSIIDISIHDPYNGREQSIRGLFKASIFELTVIGNDSFGGSDYSTKCHYFDETKQKWLMDDIHPLGIAYNQAGCWSGHLSSFIVLRTVMGINADYVIGVLVACTMGVLVLGMMVVFYVQRKNDNIAASKKAADEAKNGHSIDKSKLSNDNDQYSKRNEHIANLKRKHHTAKVGVANETETEIQSKTIVVTE